MITLITGAPGSGKSAALVAMLLELSKDRAIYCHGIPDLAVPHVELEDPTTWPDTVPDGSIIVIDECQTVWRPSGPGQKIPDHIAKLETHRHRGLDFYIITQGPNLVHTNVRALVGRHVHLRDIGFLGRWWYEWPECADNCRTGWKSAPIKKRYRLPKHVFGQYKSASIHVKPVRSFPKIVIVLAVALIAAAYLTKVVYSTISAKIAPVAITPLTPVGTPPKLPGQGAPQEPSKPAFIDDRVDFLPRITNKPESAPAYDAIRSIVNMPLVAGGICFRDTCRCVTQQGTNAGLSDRECRAWMADRPFDPYTPQERPTAASSRAGTALAGTPSVQAQTALAPDSTANVVPLPSGVSNPHADARTPLSLPPGSPVQPTPPMDELQPMPSLSLQNPYRRS